MKTLLLALFVLISLNAQAKDLWTWMIAGDQRLIVECHKRQVVVIKSFDSELKLIERTTGEKGCEIFSVSHIQDQENVTVLPNIHINATVYGLDRLKRSPSKLVDWGAFDRLIYPAKLLAVRIQTKRLGKKLTKFLEYGEFPRSEKVSAGYFRNFVEQAQMANADFITLSK